MKNEAKQAKTIATSSQHNSRTNEKQDKTMKNAAKTIDTTMESQAKTIDKTMSSQAQTIDKTRKHKPNNK